MTSDYFTRPMRTLRGSAQPVVGFGLLLLCVLWLAVWKQIETERAAIDRDLAKDAANLTLVVEQNVARTVSEIDRILKFMRQSHELEKLGSDWPSLITHDYAVNEQTVQIAVIDSKGIMITSTALLYPKTSMDLSDREHFRVHVNAVDDHLFISKPVVGRASGKWSVQFTRRFMAGGTFAGVLVVSLDPAHLSSVYNGLDLGERGGLAVVGTDEVVRAGTGIFAHSLGKSVKVTAVSDPSQQIPGGAEWVTTEINGETRQLARRVVKNLPLTVIVAGPNSLGDHAFRRKHWNYLVATFGLSILIVLAVIGTLRSRWRHEAELVHLAHHDSLTDLGNRTKFRKEIERFLANVENGEKFALHLIDLDQFKVVNDTRGHPFGDKLLRAVADRLRHVLRNRDVVARLGGDEFAIIQTNVKSGHDAANMASRLCREMKQAFEIDGLTVDVGASIGIALGDKDGRLACDLLKAADLALYAAKAGGRGNYQFYNHEMQAAIEARHALETRLRTALDQRQLELFYQPIVNIKSKAVSGYEALVRWRHPQLGLIAPGDFIPIAEETGLINPIGAWVLQTACTEMARRPAHLRVAVNFAPVQFRSASLTDMVRDALSSSGLAPARLDVEITESTLMQKDSTTIKQLRELRALGVRIVLDDFGTGYSSLSYLQTFPIGCIKIDRSFIEGLDVNPGATAIVRAITTLAATLDVDTVAEGVETQQQFDELRQLGCTEVQGYLISPPKPAVEILPDIAMYHSKAVLAA